MKEKKKIVVYTAIFGNKDKLADPLEVNKNCDYVCFTDKNINSKVYKIVKLDSFFGSPRMDAKYFKVLPHFVFPQYDYCLWVDGSVVIKKDPVRYIIEKFNQAKYIAFKHSLRDCVYQEARVVKKWKFDSSKLVDKQVEKYRNEGYSENNGLFENAIIWRDHKDPEIIDIDTEWWNEIKQYSLRDQISLPYVFWKNKFRPKLFDGTVYENEYFEVRKHNRLI
jgi:hypothetical protein